MTFIWDLRRLHYYLIFYIKASAWAVIDLDFFIFPISLTTYLFKF
jgi:hypothetical protein